MRAARSLSDRRLWKAGGRRPEDLGWSASTERPCTRTEVGAITLATACYGSAGSSTPRTSRICKAAPRRFFVCDVVELLDEPRGMDLTHGGKLRTGLSTGTAAGGLDLTEHGAQRGLRHSHAI